MQHVLLEKRTAIVLLHLLLSTPTFCDGATTVHSFSIISTSTFLSACRDMAQIYSTARIKYNEFVNITCISLEIADQVKMVNATDTANITLKSSAGVILNPTEVASITLLLMRTPMYTGEANDFRTFFTQYPVFLNCIFVGYNVPEIAALGQDLRLTQQNLVGIYNGTILYWNDTSLLDANPYLMNENGSSILPGRRIQLGFRNDRYLSTWILTKTLSAFDANWASTYGAIQDGTAFVTNVKSIRGFLSNKNTGLSLYGFMSDRPYTMAVVPQEDVARYGIKTALIENKRGLFTTCDELSIEDAVRTSANDASIRALTGSVSNLDGNLTYPLLGRSFVGMLQGQLGKRSALPDCIQLASSLRFLNWIIDEANDLSRQILASNFFVLAPLNWYTAMLQGQEGLRCGDRKQLVRRFISSMQAAEDMYDWTHDANTWAYVISGLLLGLLAAAYYGRYGYWYLNRLRRENMEQYAISSKHIRITPSLYSPVDRYKGVVASRKVVDRYIPTASLQCLSAGTWGEYEVFLRPCSLVLHRLNHRARMRILELMELSNHKNVCRFYGMTELPGGRCLVCNFCPFGDLRTLVISKKHIFSMNTKFSLAGDIAEGMEYLHSRGLVHGNLRSCAVYIEANWTAKISDFEYDTLHQVQGSFHPTVAQLKQKLNLYQQTSLYPWLYWTAPEILQQGITGREIPPEKSADVYSFGIVCSEIFSMEPAYQKYQELPYKLTPAQILNGILTADMRPRDDYKTTSTPRCILRVMEHCWQERSSHRPAFSTLRSLFRSVRSLRRHVADKIMIAAEKTAEAVKNRSEAASSRLGRFDQEFHKYSKILVPPAYWRSIYKQKLYMSMTRHKLGIVFYCNLVGYGNLIDPERTARALDCINLLHKGFQDLIDKGGRVYRVYRNGTGFVALGNVPYGVKEDPIDSIAHLAFDFLTWAWRVKLPAHLMDGFQLQIGIHSGPLTAGTLKHSTNQFIPLGPVQKEAWDIVRSSAPCRILISEDFHQNLRQLAQIFIKYRIVPNPAKVFGYNKKTYWLVGMNYYRGQSLLDDIFLLDPDNLEAEARLASRKDRKKKGRKGALKNELVKVVSALPFDYQALTAGGTQYLVDMKEREKRRSVQDRLSTNRVTFEAPSIHIEASTHEDDSEAELAPPQQEAVVSTTTGDHAPYVVQLRKAVSVTSKVVEVSDGRHSPETEKALKRLRTLKKKEYAEIENKKKEEIARHHMLHEVLEAEQHAMDEVYGSGEMEQGLLYQDDWVGDDELLDYDGEYYEEGYYEQESDYQITSEAYQYSDQDITEHPAGLEEQAQNLRESLHLIRESEVLEGQLHQNLVALANEPHPYDIDHLQTAILIDDDNQTVDTGDEGPEEGEHRKKKKKKKSKRRDKRRSEVEEV